MKNDLLRQLVLESQAYKRFEDIEKLVEGGMDLSALPVQPLFVALRSTSKDQVATILPRLSATQRQALLDIDLWKKDEIDLHSSRYWLEVYGQCPDDKVRLDFARSEDFLLAIKSQCVIYTFDAEDPEYPESDNYFLTEDNLLLVEYPEDFSYVSELKQLIKDLYTELGVEHAYAHLFKMVSDSYMVMEEESYQQKKERLRDVGFVDYYEAMEMEAIFHSVEEAKSFVTKRLAQVTTGAIDDDMKNQTLHASSLVAYQEGMDELRQALGEVESQQRKDFLQFNFVRLINARIVAHEALKGGSVAISKASALARQRLELGFSFARAQVAEGRLVFENLDFQDLFRLGHSLLEIPKRKLKRALGGTAFEHEDHEYFLGMWWTSFLDHSFAEAPRLKLDGSSEAKLIDQLAAWELWTKTSESFVALLPFIKKFHLVLSRLRESGDLQDSFYLNYELASVDFEAIMLSSLVNFSLGHFERSEAAKMGVRLDELKLFYQKYFVAHGNEWLLESDDRGEFAALLDAFTERFGLAQVPGFARWLGQIIVEQMNGYEVMRMGDEDFRHVGGPLILVPARS